MELSDDEASEEEFGEGLEDLTLQTEEVGQILKCLGWRKLMESFYSTVLFSEVRVSGLKITRKVNDQ